MNLETEKILGTLEVFTETRLEFRLPDNEYSSIVPFIWDVTQKGNFSLLNLGRDEGWINKTDIDVAVKSWQSLERRGYLNLDDAPDDYTSRLTGAVDIYNKINVCRALPQGYLRESSCP